ncbi:MAG: hypothetical protein JO041_08160 [Acidobacteria bacterium]|nr:hypothetical protein [Acidobacteriota bacterium]
MSTPAAELPQPVALAPVSAGRLRHPLLTGLFVVLTLYLGGLVIMLPWRDAWAQNTLLDAYPAIRAIAMNNFVRGLVSGVGALDLWVGIAEVIQYRRSRR